MSYRSQWQLTLLTPERMSSDKVIIPTIDLFAGAGGLSLGFHLADVGFMPVFAVEHDQAAAGTFERNFGCEVFAGDIEYGPRYPEADLIIGGPPCQGFSPLDAIAMTKAGPDLTDSGNTSSMPCAPYGRKLSSSRTFPSFSDRRSSQSFCI